MKFSLSIFTLFVAFILANHINAQPEVLKYKNDEPMVEYNLTHGMLNGKYVSYYINGVKKAEGCFQFNNRIGEWSLWDTTGKLCYQRFYTDPYSFRIAISSSSPIPTKQYIPHRNSDSCYEWYLLEEKDIKWSRRTWGIIYCNNNPILDNKVFNVLYTEILSHKIEAYKFKKDIDTRFRDSVNITKTPMDSSCFKVIGFMLKEDWYYDSSYGIMDCRTLGICPLVMLKKPITKTNTKYLAENVEAYDKDTIGLFWVFYPQVRPYLAKEKVFDANMPKYISNLDDIFFWRYYNKVLYDDLAGNMNYPIQYDRKLWLNLIDWEQSFWQGKWPWD